MHAFIDGGPIDNQYKFCPYCGLALDELPYSDMEDDDSDFSAETLEMLEDAERRITSVNEQLPKDTQSTPRTDAEHSRADEYYEGTRVVTADFARQLERELNEALKDANRYRWLRHGDNDEAVIRMSGHKRNNYPFLLRNDELDAVIDSKMTEQS